VLNSKTWLNNLYEPLLDLGHDVYIVRIDEAAIHLNAKIESSIFREKFSEYILTEFKNEHKKQKFDLFFSYFLDKHIDPQVIKEIKKSGVPTANFSCNNTHQFYLTENIAPHYDFNLYSEKSAGEKFKNIDANSVWFQMAANPNIYYPIDVEYKYDVSFLGSSYAKRAEYIFNLLEYDINVDCFGPNWLINKPNEKIKAIYKECIRLRDLFSSIFSISRQKRYILSSKVRNFELQCLLRNKYGMNMHYPLPDEGIVRLFSESKINLGFLEVFSTDNKTHSMMKQHLHLREFEIPMSGGLYITNYSDELAEHYEPDKEVLIYRNSYELIDKVKYYLINSSEADEIRKAGLKRARDSHTYQKRFNDLFNKIKLQ
jgi:spore maturation protein CgeB